MESEFGNIKQGIVIGNINNDKDFEVRMKKEQTESERDSKCHTQEALRKSGKLLTI